MFNNLFNAYINGPGHTTKTEIWGKLCELSDEHTDNAVSAERKRIATLLAHELIPLKNQNPVLLKILPDLRTQILNRILYLDNIATLIGIQEEFKSAMQETEFKKKAQAESMAYIVAHAKDERCRVFWDGPKTQPATAQQSPLQELRTMVVKACETGDNRGNIGRLGAFIEVMGMIDEMEPTP
jgi:hypothetical protein